MLGQNIGRVGLPDMSSGGRPSLTLDFVGIPVLNERITFSRTSGATWFSPDGVLKGVDFSASSVAIGTGSKSFTLDATAGVNRYWAVGDLVRVSQQSNSANFMEGTVTSYTASTQVLVIDVTSTGGSGTITSWRVSSHMPRFDYNPATLAARGLLIEEARTNLLTYSEDFGNASWTKGGATVTANSTIAPDGATTADTLIENTSTGSHRVFRTTSGTTNTNPYTYSVFAKANTRTRIYLAILEGTSFVRQGNAVFDLSAGTVVSIGGGSGGASGGSATIQNVGNGWYRCSYTLTLGGTDTTIFNDLALVDTGTTISYTGDGTSGLFLWGAQLEAGAFPTSYIPTTTTALTRSADVASVNTLSPWFNSTASTLYAEWTNLAAAIPTGGTQIVTEIAELTNANFYRIFQSQAAGAKASSNMFSGGANPGRLDSGGAYSNATVEAAAAFAASDRAISANGAVATTSATGALPVGVTALFLGQQAGSTNFLNGWLRRIVYYPRRLTNAELVTLTT